MRIGLDFDNTIVSYDRTFHAVAVEQGLVPASTAPTKLAVRGHLRAIDREDDWTLLQGHVYGVRMDQVESFPGALDFMQWARGAGHELYICSHKTQFPYMGPRHDLRAAARAWVQNHLNVTQPPVLPEDCVFFEETKADKAARIAAVGCELFVDDLPEILGASDFPAATRPVLFDPADAHAEETTFERVGSWSQLQALVDRLN